MKQSRVYIFIISLLFFSVFLLNVSRVYAYQMYESSLEPHSSFFINLFIYRIRKENIS